MQEALTWLGRLRSRDRCHDYLPQVRIICVQAQASSGQAGRFDESRCGGFIVAGEEFKVLVRRRLAGDSEERMTLQLRCAARIPAQTPTCIADCVSMQSLKGWRHPDESAPLLKHRMPLHTSIWMLCLTWD